MSTIPRHPTNCGCHECCVRMGVTPNFPDVFISASDHFYKGMIRASQIVRAHWNYSSTMVNQKEQAARSADAIIRDVETFRSSEVRHNEVTGFVNRETGEIKFERSPTQAEKCSVGEHERAPYEVPFADYLSGIPISSKYAPGTGPESSRNCWVPVCRHCRCLYAEKP